MKYFALILVFLQYYIKYLFRLLAFCFFGTPLNYVPKRMTLFPSPCSPSCDIGNAFFSFWFITFFSSWSMSHKIYLWGPVTLLYFPPRWNLAQVQASFSPLAHIWRTEKSYISFTEQILGKEANPRRASILCSVTEPAGQHVSTVWLSGLLLDISLSRLKGWSKGAEHALLLCLGD